MHAHEDALKGQAKRLRSALAEEDVMLGHRKTLDLIARIHGWRNWHVLSAALEQGKPIASGVTQSPMPHKPGEKTNMTIQPDGTVPSYLNTTLSTTDQTPVIDVFNALPETIGKWKRDLETEARALGMGGRFVHYIRQDDNEPLLALAVDRDGKSAEVVNIVPKPGGKDIELKEANRLEKELIGLLTPLLPSNVTIKQNAETKHLRNLVSAATYDMFRYHSMNKSTGNSHPLDRERWLKFVAQAAREGLDDRDEHVALVRQALLSEGFADRHANQMAKEYGTQIEAIRSVL